jgi:3-phenylpropionate/trans-cinnamate dioxygenase ferredoxin subunit
MTEYVRVAAVDDIPPGHRLIHEFEEDTVIVFNVAGSFYCIADLCSHDGGPLEGGELHQCEIECPRHGARFDIRTGKPTALPAAEAIPSYGVKIEDGGVWVESPDVW